MNLYEISNDYAEQMSLLKDMGLDDETLEDTLDSISGDLETKCINVAKVILDMDSDTKAISDEIRRLRLRAAASARRSDRLKDYLKSSMVKCCRLSIKTPLMDVRVQSNPPSVRIDNPDLIPRQFVTVTEDVKFDRRAIKNNGGCDGATVVTAGLRIEIK